MRISRHLLFNYLTGFNSNIQKIIQQFTKNIYEHNLMNNKETISSRVGKLTTPVLGIKFLPDSRKKNKNRWVFRTFASLAQLLLNKQNVT